MLSRNIDAPISYQDAKSSHEWLKWEEAIKAEYQSLIENNTWEIVDKPKDRKLLKNKWVFTKKHNEKGDVVRYKARFVIKGYSQDYGIDYTES